MFRFTTHFRGTVMERHTKLNIRVGGIAHQYNTCLSGVTPGFNSNTPNKVITKPILPINNINP